MTVEIERKFLVAEPPAAAITGSGETFRQGYVALDGEVSVRVRITDTAAALTVKAGGGLSRTEVELPISAAQAEALWAHTAGRRIDKVRYRVPLGQPAGHVADLDVYGGELGGLCTVEVEFVTEAEARAFVPPDWFGREVTGEAQWTNAALARDGLPGSDPASPAG